MKRRNKMSQNPSSAKHNDSFDILRIIAAFSVVVLHVSGQFIMAYPVGSTQFCISNFINSVSRFGVPIFVMISGAIFLSEEKTVTIPRIWSKNILRLLIVFLIWSFGYYVFQSLYLWHYDFWNQGLLRTFTGCIYASEHFWFLFMIMGLYALVPILRTWVHHATTRELYYFTTLFVVFQILRSTCTILLDKSLIYKLSDMMTIVELSGYLGYFVLGYLLTKRPVSTKFKLAIYCLVPVGIIANYSVSHYLSNRSGAYTPGIYDCFGIFTFIHIMALFLFVTDLVPNGISNKRVSSCLNRLALDTLGIYMMHVALLEYFVEENILFGQLHPLPGILLLSFICFFISGIVSAILRRIPFLGHYIC